MKRPSNNVIWMSVIILLLVICIVTRWEYIAAEVAAAFGGLFSR